MVERLKYKLSLPNKMKTLEQQLKELKKQLKDDIAVKIISKKNKFKIVQVVTKTQDEEEGSDDFPVKNISPKNISKINKELIKVKNYIG